MGTLRRRRPPARIVHLGLGAFARAHAFWYTEHAADGEEWGIAGFTGRSPRQADLLDAQDGVYSLLTRGPDRAASEGDRAEPEGDRAETIDALVAARDGGDGEALAAAVADPAAVVVTLTITENGYTEGSPALARLAAALDARRRADAGPLALVPCDNLPANGEVLDGRLRAIAERGPAGLADWIDASVSFVSTVVDRITPATTDTDLAAAARLVGARDAAPVVTEPYSAWTLAGDFPAGRPAWAAEFVDDVRPAEHRKLWLLNGSHSLLAYRGLALGHSTVAEAMADPRCADLVARLWAEAGEVLPYDAETLAAYTAELSGRYANARIEHRLAQIATDGSAKLGPRILDPLRDRLAAGIEPGEAQAATLASWIDYVADGRAEGDAVAAELAPRLDGASRLDQARTVLAALAPDLADTPAVVDAIADALGSGGRAASGG